MGQGPALGLGSAQQLNQQIISSGQSRGISILLLSSRPAQLNPFIHVSLKPQSFGVSQGECCRGAGCSTPRVLQPVSPRRSDVRATVAARELAVAQGEPSVPCLAARLFTSGQPDDSASLYYQLQKPGS